VDAAGVDDGEGVSDRNVVLIGGTGVDDDLVVTEPPIQYYIDILESEKKIKPGAVAVKDVYTNEFNALAKANV